MDDGLYSPNVACSSQSRFEIPKFQFTLCHKLINSAELDAPLTQRPESQAAGKSDRPVWQSLFSWSPDSQRPSRGSLPAFSSISDWSTLADGIRCALERTCPGDLTWRLQTRLGDLVMPRPENLGVRTTVCRDCDPRIIGCRTWPPT